MKTPLLLASIASAALAATLTAGPADDIAAKHAAASAKELEDYIAKNPDAEDKSAAVDHLLAAYQLTGETKRIAALNQMKFDAIKGGPDLDVRALYSTTQTLFNSLADSGDKEGARKVIAAAIEKAKGHRAGPQLKQAFSQLEGQLNQPGVGDVMDIKFTSMKGEEIDLSKMKGKVVLVDFWATWCGPCIQELPNVQDAYAKFHDKGFEIIAISLDKDESKLKKFVEDKKLPWAQHFDGKGWSNEISTSFGITSIPATYLIGKDGTVVDKNLRGPALAKAIEKHLGAE